MATATYGIKIGKYTMKVNSNKSANFQFFFTKQKALNV